MKRRAFLQGLIAAPVVITTPKLLMPIRAVVMPFPDPGVTTFWISTGIESEVGWTGCLPAITGG